MSTRYAVKHTKGSIRIAKLSQKPTACIAFRLPAMEIYKACYDFRDDRATSLGFKKDDKFFVTEKSDTGWWAARSLETNRVGYIPSAYVEFLALVNPISLDYMETQTRPEKIKMDALCELTAKIQECPGMGRNHPSYPPEDYLNNDDNSPSEVRKSTKPIAKSTEQTKLQKDLKFNQQRGINLGRPELVKTWEKFESKKSAKEMELEKESELSAKLKTISKKLEEDEKQKQTDDGKPEFMKVHLRKAKPQAAS